MSASLALAIPQFRIGETRKVFVGGALRRITWVSLAHMYVDGKLQKIIHADWSRENVRFNIEEESVDV